ncbi:MAG: CoA transferase [Brevundimonas sp.]|nr:CoA transferase [Brevundimonas sp.]
MDFTTFLSGPFATQILADLGAEVVKIEAPDGDMTRSIPPYMVGEDSAYFLSTNRGKRSLAVDMKTPEGKALVLDLIGKADVVVENYRPGVTARLGLDVVALRKANPSLIWASITGFGQEGPWRDKPAYDMIAQALSGVMSLTGESGRPAVRLGIPGGDVIAGMYAVIAINAALAERERTGMGRTIDVAMLDSLLSMLAYQSAYALIGGVTPGPQGARHDSIPTYRSFMAGDGAELVVTANTEKMWAGLCDTVQRPELVRDARFATGKDRLRNKEALWSILEPLFLERSAADWVDRLERNDVPCAEIRSVPEALADARAGARSMIVNYSGPDGETVSLVGDPIKFVGAPSPAAAYPPRLGVDSAYVLGGWLGMASDDIDALLERRVLFTR